MSVGKLLTASSFFCSGNRLLGSRQIVVEAADPDKPLALIDSYRPPKHIEDSPSGSGGVSWC